MTGPHDAVAAVLLPGFAGPQLPGWLASRLRDGLAGVCLFGENITSAEQLRDLTAAIRAANPRSVVAIDEEGGDVTRLHHDRGSPYPGNAVLGRIDDLGLTRRVARLVGAELVSAGINLDLAPDADVNSTADNPVIGVRSFGADAAVVARHTAAWVTGLQSTGVAAGAKHFPGHGDTAQDSHLALPVVDRSLAQLRDRELLPFAAAVAAGTRTVMTSHILLPQLDPTACATFSPSILGDLLRGELGFDGVVICDALDMVGASGGIGVPAAAVLAVAAGCDLLCLGTRTTERGLAATEAALAAAVTSGRLDPARPADAAARVARLLDWVAAAAAAPRVPQGVRGSDLDEVSGTGFSTEVTAASFAVAPGIRIGGDRHVVVVETAVNIAIGPVPWGPSAAGWVVAQVMRDGDQLLGPPPGAQLVIVGRDNHRHDWVVRLVADARSRYPGSVVVDMGWPDEDRRYADIATFGASRHVALALRRLLPGPSR